MPQINVLTGASGVGKTTLVENLTEKLDPKNFEFCHFDSIGVPSFEEMIRDYGSTEQWQKVKTFEWIERLIKLAETKRIVFEGSSSLAFIQEGFRLHAFSDYQIILIDCSEQEMNRRLIERNQPELVNEHMANWLQHLRKQATELGVEVLDSSQYSKADILELFIHKFLEKRKN